MWPIPGAGGAVRRRLSVAAAKCTSMSSLAVGAAATAIYAHVKGWVIPLPLNYGKSTS